MLIITMDPWDAQVNEAQTSTRATAEEQDKSCLTDLSKSKNVEEIPLHDVDEQQHTKILAMFTKHEVMCSGHFWKIEAT